MCFLSNNYFCYSPCLAIFSRIINVFPINKCLEAFYFSWFFFLCINFLSTGSIILETAPAILNTYGEKSLDSSIQNATHRFSFKYSKDFSLSKPKILSIFALSKFLSSTALNSEISVTTWSSICKRLVKSPSLFRLLSRIIIASRFPNFAPKRVP